MIIACNHEMKVLILTKAASSAAYAVSVLDVGKYERVWFWFRGTEHDNWDNLGKNIIPHTQKVLLITNFHNFNNLKMWMFLLA